MPLDVEAEDGLVDSVYEPLGVGRDGFVVEGLPAVVVY